MQIAIALAALAALAILAGAYLRFRLPAATLTFSSVTGKTQEARVSGWTIRKTVVFEGTQLIRFRIRRGLNGLKVHTTFPNSDMATFDSVNPLPARRNCDTRQAGIYVTWAPDCAQQALRRTSPQIPV